jgi:hypothetical protein
MKYSSVFEITHDLRSDGRRTFSAFLYIFQKNRSELEVHVLQGSLKRLSQNVLGAWNKGEVKLPLGLTN